LANNNNLEKMPNSDITKVLEEIKRNKRFERFRIANVIAHVAVIVYRGKIIASAVNRIGYRQEASKSYYNTYLHTDRNLHAEENVVRSLGNYNKMKDADMYIMKFGRGQNDGAYVNSKPCAKCECFLNKCMREYKLKRVFYTTS
jgi:deoxycytidylate deaminase